MSSIPPESIATAAPQGAPTRIALAICAYVTVMVCMIAVLKYSDLNEYAKGTITLVLGRFLGYVDNIYNFEFGTTRGSKSKDDVIASLAAPEAAPVAAAPVVSAQRKDLP